MSASFPTAIAQRGRPLPPRLLSREEKLTRYQQIHHISVLPVGHGAARIQIGMACNPVNRKWLTMQRV